MLIYSKDNFLFRRVFQKTFSFIYIKKQIKALKSNNSFLNLLNSYFFLYICKYICTFTFNVVYTDLRQFCYC